MSNPCLIQRNCVFQAYPVLTTVMIVKLARAKNLPHPLETRGLNSHLTPVERAKEGAKSKTEPAVELFSEKTSGGGTPHKKVENNYLAGCPASLWRSRKEGENVGR